MVFGNWEEMGDRMMFERSVRSDEGGSVDLKVESAKEIQGLRRLGRE